MHLQALAQLCLAIVDRLSAAVYDRMENNCHIPEWKGSYRQAHVSFLNWWSGSGNGLTFLGTLS